jgi:hypothetical protein
LISELFLENFLRGEKWMTIFLHGRKGSPSEGFGKFNIGIDQNITPPPARERELPPKKSVLLFSFF